MWLLQTAIRLAFERATAAGMTPTAEQQLDYVARISASHNDGDGPRLLTIAGGSAEIAITGAITNRPSLMAYLFGGGNTTYSDIVAAIAVAEQDPAVETITFSIDSPGGTIAGLFDTLAAIEAVTKPTQALVANMAASAAYAIAAQTDKIIAGNRAAVFGSVGVVVSGFTDEHEVTIASTDAPNKAPDIGTEEGRAVVRGELDAMHDLLAESIAGGRSLTVDQVNADFGKGGTLLADEALKRGMIDSIAGSALSLVQTGGDVAAFNENQPEAIDMDLMTLQASHAGVYAEVLALGNAAGVTQERERASAHLIMGAGSGDMATAIKAVQDGVEMTQSLQATYTMAAVNRRDTQDATEDDAAVAAAVGSAAAATDTDTADAKIGEGILNGAAALCGVEIGA